MKKIFIGLSFSNIFLLILLIILSTSIPINSQTIILIKGNKFFDENIYLRWINLNNKTNLFAGISDTIKSRIENNLRNEGFYFPHFQSLTVDTSKKLIEISIDEGLPAIVKNIFIKMNLEDSTRIKNYFKVLYDEKFSELKLQSAIDESITYLENNGYPFAKITIESISFVKQDDFYSTNILLSLEQNTKCYVNKFIIEGNFKTKDYVIIRETGIEPDQFYRQSDIDKIKHKLNRLRYFETVEEPIYYLTNENKGVLKLSIKEKETNSFDGIIGYVPSSQFEKGYFTGFLNLNFENLFGTGRFFKFKWQQLNKTSQDLDIKYLEPWIFNYPFNIQVGLFQRKQDSTYIQRNFESSFEYLSNRDFSVSFVLTSQSTISLVKSNRNIYNSSTLSYGFALKNDTRDEIYSPTSGILFNGSYKYFSKKFNDFTISKTSLQKIEFDFSFFTELFFKQIFVLSIHAKELKGNLADISDLFYLGGTNSLRGYREKQFFGNRILWTNLEYRYLFSKYSFGFLFFDTGYYQLNENQSFSIQLQKDFKIGYGFGLNIETGVGILGISFALGKGDSFTDGKIHFAIMNEF